MDLTRDAVEFHGDTPAGLADRPKPPDEGQGQGQGQGHGEGHTRTIGAKA
jgi:hypothetical protein